MNTIVHNGFIDKVNFLKRTLLLILINKFVTGCNETETESKVRDKKWTLDEFELGHA